ncbi:MAG: cyclic pyranopterin monophosphate synthase MoaC [Polyangiaceae bacterium]|nr:cyclic pyranopterin monophosphate synthase MoaC [Polyangiaceae bacterium]
MSGAKRRASPGARGAAGRLTHVSPEGHAHMVDVGEKPETSRSAIAEARVTISPELERAIREDRVKKGSVLEVARIAGIQAAKRTSELIPLCHPLALDAVELSLQLEPRTVVVEARVRCRGRTGVEMEALTAVSVAALTVVDMGKAIDREMTIHGVLLREKHGGRSGDFVRGAGAHAAGAASGGARPRARRR